MGQDEVASSILGALASAVVGFIKNWYINHLRSIKIDAHLDEAPPFALGLDNESDAMERVATYPNHELLTDASTVWIDRTTVVIDISNVSDHEIAVANVDLHKFRTGRKVNFAVQYIPQGDSLPEEFFVLLDDENPHIERCERNLNCGKLEVLVDDYFGRYHARLVVAAHESERIVLTIGALSGSWQVNPTLEITSPYFKRQISLFKHPVQIVAGSTIPDSNKYWTLDMRNGIWGTGFYMPNLEIPQAGARSADKE
ncbi:MAG: hypothetical protein LKF00_05605 [Olsenella sp.]|jgi:hypothetical protein|nr:hypothetical protein [Olsenella sp.]MCI1289915.1 hypothetical protein [Olsenella sp.]